MIRWGLRSTFQKGDISILTLQIQQIYLSPLVTRGRQFAGRQLVGRV